MAFLLKEDSGFLLLETGDRIILDGDIYTTSTSTTSTSTSTTSTSTTSTSTTTTSTSTTSTSTTSTSTTTTSTSTTSTSTTSTSTSTTTMYYSLGKSKRRNDPSKGKVWDIDKGKRVLE